MLLRRILFFLAAVAAGMVITSSAHALCLTIERDSTFAYWVNTCSIGVHVTWRNMDNGVCRSAIGCTGCERTTYDDYPCLGFVAAFDRSPATLWGLTKWAECQSDDPYGGCSWLSTYSD